MCRSIKTLRSTETPATDDDVRAAALQFVRKISGFRAPSRVNEAVFDAAVEEITLASHRLLGSLVTPQRKASSAHTRGSEQATGSGYEAVGISS
jgi:hypothetical protein